MPRTAALPAFTTRLVPLIEDLPFEGRMVATARAGRAAVRDGAHRDTNPHNPADDVRERVATKM